MNASIELLPVGIVLGLFALMAAPLFAFIALLVVALAGVAAFVALTGAVLATPYLLGHSLLRRLRARSGASRHQALNAHTERTRPIRGLTATGEPGWRTG